MSFLFMSPKMQRPYPQEDLGRNIKQAVQKPGVNKRVASHIFRHSCAAHLLQSGIDLCSIQELLGHKSVETMMIYTHVAAEMNKGGTEKPSGSLKKRIESTLIPFGLCLFFPMPFSFTGHR